MPGATTPYAIYISGSRGNMQLPVNPQEYTIRYPDDNQKYNVLDIGEVIQSRLPALKIVSWEGLLPGSGEAFETGGVSAETFINNITAYMKNTSGDKVRFIASRQDDAGYLFDTNFKCIVTDFAHWEKGGEPGDVYYSIELTEYKTFAAEVLSLVPTTTASTVKADATPQRDTGGTISVGDSVRASGTYYYDSYGATPTGKASNLLTTVTRIVGSPKSGQRYPYHIGSYGWLTVGQLTKV